MTVAAGAAAALQFDLALRKTKLANHSFLNSFDAREQPLKSFRPTRQHHTTYTVYVGVTYEYPILRHLRVSIVDKMWWMQKGFLLFPGTSSNRNAPIDPFYGIMLTSNLGVEETQRSLQNLSNGEST